MKRTIRLLLMALAAVTVSMLRADDRADWAAAAERLAAPVLTALAEDRLGASLGDPDPTAVLECVGRTFCGIAPWLELPNDGTPEGETRERLLGLAHRALRNVMEPTSKDHLSVARIVPKLHPTQPLVEGAFLAQALLRAPKRLWGGLDAETQTRLIAFFKDTRRIRPFRSNWLCFAGEVEAFLLSVTGECDVKRLSLAPDAFMDGWYKGDGVYGDGAPLHLDYYNSFVIHPMLADILAAQVRLGLPKAAERQKTQQRRFRRYADWLERLVAPDGSYPAYGRSLAYRMGAFQPLAMAPMKGRDWHTVPPGQVRAALTAVVRRQGGPWNYAKDGFLLPGFNGDQPEMCDKYVCRGSLYLASAIFLPLGLPPGHPFWSEPAQPWTSKRAWEGQPFPNDHAIAN